MPGRVVKNVSLVGSGFEDAKIAHHAEHSEFVIELAGSSSRPQAVEICVEEEGSPLRYYYPIVFVPDSASEPLQRK